jgi:diaminopimelate decarboxylase
VGPLSAWGRLRDRSRLARETGAFELEQFAARLGEAYRQLIEGTDFEEPPALAIEAGRAIVGNVGLLLARIEAIQGKWVFLDASCNYLGESTLLFRRHILPLERRSGPYRFLNLSGSTLNTMDVLDMRRRLPPVETGDVLAFLDAGAYSISRARRYAGLSPAVYWLGADGSLERIRRAEEFRDLAGPMELDVKAETS